MQGTVGALVFGWTLTSGDTTSHILGATALVAVIAFSALVVWNGVRLKRGELPIRNRGVGECAV
jgi:Sec-independent protein secretion pathway component TatC